VGYRKGPIVECPKCKQVGRETVIKVKAKGHEYYYRAVIHLDGRKCTIERVDEPPPQVEELFQLRELVEKLQEENRWLRERMAQAEAEAAMAEARAAVAKQVLSNAIWLRERELAALRAVYITKKGYTAEQLSIAKGIMHDIVEKGLAKGLAVISFPPPPLVVERDRVQVLGEEREGEEAS